MAVSAPDPFLASVPVFARFGEIANGDGYVPVPDDWMVGLADVVDSTRAVEAGRYKAVNFAGAAVIAAMGNALGGRTFPFVFGGDGASFVVPAADDALAREILAATATLVAEEFELHLRVALVPIGAIRAEGLDIRLSFFAASPDVSYAMFSGGGLAWAERKMKEGAFAVAPAAPGTRPDLNGLSCRFEPMASRRGVILSLIVRREPGADDAAYRRIIQEITSLVEASPAMASPVPEQGPTFGWPPKGLDLEARLLRGAGTWLPLLWARVIARSAAAYVSFRFGLRFGAFDPKIYLGQLVGNSDYRKYDDGLRMTIDCTSELADTIETTLSRARGIVAYGAHRQASAMMTCFTPSVHRRDHVHFVDGAAGGYSAAAVRLKAMP